MPVLALLFCTWPAFGHAILLSAAPAAHARVSGPKIPVTLRFNSRVDGKRSRLLLVQPDGHTRVLPIGDQSAPNTLTSEATASQSGAYVIRWQVLSQDGHITRGDLPFLVP